MWWLAFALAGSGSKKCTMQGKALDIQWTEAGNVKVIYGGSPVVSASIGERKGPTSATCLPTGVKFLTDTQEVPGKFTLETVKMDLKSVLQTLRDPEPAPEVAVKKPPPRKPRPKPKPKPDVGKREASECVQTKAWDAYADDWRVRSVTTEKLEAGASRNLALQFIAKQEVRLIVCSEAKVPELEVLLVNDGGFKKAADEGDRQLELQYTSRKTGTYHLLVTNPGESVGHVAVAVMTRTEPSKP